MWECKRTKTSSCLVLEQLQFYSRDTSTHWGSCEDVLISWSRTTIRRWIPKNAGSLLTRLSRWWIRDSSTWLLKRSVSRRQNLKMQLLSTGTSSMMIQIWSRICLISKPNLRSQLSNVQVQQKGETLKNHQDCRGKRVELSDYISVKFKVD